MCLHPVSVCGKVCAVDYGHALNLAIGNVMKQCKVCSDALDIALDICKFIKFSPNIMLLLTE